MQRRPRSEFLIVPSVPLAAPLTLLTFLQLRFPRLEGRPVPLLNCASQFPVLVLVYGING